MTALRAALLSRTVFHYPPEQQDGDLPMLSALAAGSARLDLLVQRGAAHGTAPAMVERGTLRVWYGPAGASPAATVRWLWWAYRTLRHIDRSSGLDVINGSDLFGALVAVSAAGPLGAAAVAQLQGDFLTARPGTYGAGRERLVRRLALHVAHRADRTRCLFTAAAQALTEAGIPAERVVVLPSRCDVRRFDPARTSVAAASEQLLFIGNVVIAKGLTELFDAVALLRERRGGVQLMIIGDGRDAEALRARATALGLGACVHWLGRRPAAELPNLIAACAALVLPSRSEGTPRVLLEAMAMGRPVVATRVGGVADLVRDGVDGWLVPEGDVAALVDALDTVLAAQPWPALAASAARERVVARYSLDAHVRGMLALHEAAVRHRCRGHD